MLILHVSSIRNNNSDSVSIDMWVCIGTENVSSPVFLHFGKIYAKNYCKGLGMF